MLEYNDESKTITHDKCGLPSDLCMCEFIPLIFDSNTVHFTDIEFPKSGVEFMGVIINEEKND